MIIPRSYCFEVLLNNAPAAGIKYTFPNNLGALNNAIVVGVEVYSAAQLVNTPLTYATNTPAAGMLSAVMVLVEGVTDRIRQIPLYDLIPSLNGGLQREFKPFKINISKSYIQCVAATSLTQNQGFVVNMIYMTPAEFKTMMAARRK